jgi:hypothetical protein
MRHIDAEARILYYQILQSHNRVITLPIILE